MKTLIVAIFRFFTNRLFILSVVVAGMFYILIAALFNLQIIEGDTLAKQFELSVLRDVEIEGQRGNIYDRNGYPLAENVIAYDVMLNDSIEVKDKNSMIHELIKIVESHGDEVINDFPLKLEADGFVIEGSEKSILNFKKNIFNKRYTSLLSEEQVAMSAFDVYRYMRDDLFEVDPTLYTTEEILDILNIRYAQYIKRYSKYQPETIAKNISAETMADIEERRDIFPGVSIEESPYRVYNDAPYFAHIIGYTRDIDSNRLELLKPLGYDADDVVGVVGIEEEMELDLHGYDGYKKVEVNNLGKTMLVLEEVAPVTGNDVYLTIDRDLQIRTYDLLEKQLSEILVDKLMMVAPIKDPRVILLKDVYDSIFRYDLIDVSGIKSLESETASYVYTTMMKYLDMMVVELKTEIENDTPPKDFAAYSTIYDNLFSYLIQGGLLKKGYADNEAYKSYVAGEISLRSLMLAFSRLDMLVLPQDNPPVLDEEIWQYVLNYLNDDYYTNANLELDFYLYALDKEYIRYLELTKLIIEMGLVSATEEDITRLNNRRLSPLDFMKDKLLALEIKPYQLALDPSSGSIVITDVDTGEVLALVSYPTYDNSRLVNGFDNNYYLELLQDPTDPLIARATKSRSAPGSTFKMVTAMAALDSGIISTKETVFAKGLFDKVSPAAKCWIYDRGGIHGSINVSEAIEESCNYFFYEMGYRLSTTDTGRISDAQGINILQDYAMKFGLDSQTGLEVEESDSLLPSQYAVRSTIGQGNNSYTPVQLARYMNALANDGIVKELNVVDKVMTQEGQLVYDKTPKTLKENDFDPTYLKAIKDGMLAVTSGASGTARAYFADLPISIAGKTGTAELYKTRANHAVFTGFAPAESPEISVAAVIQFGYSSKYAALTANKVFKLYFGLLDSDEGYTYGHQLD